MSNQFVKDAERLQDFFINAEQTYNSEFSDKGLVHFCLSVFGVDKFDMSEVELAVDNLNSIVSIISRNIPDYMQDKFLSIVRGSVDKYIKWLRAVHNFKIREDSYELLFGDGEYIDAIVNMAGNVNQLPDNFFSLLVEFTDKKVLPVVDAELDNIEQKKDMATDIICNMDGKMVYIFNDIPWTDRNKIWIGNRRNLEKMISGKYRKVRDKFLSKTISELYIRLGDELLFKTVVVDKDLTFRKGSDIKIELNRDSPDRFVVIRKGDANVANKS